MHTTYNNYCNYTGALVHISIMDFSCIPDSLGCFV